VRTGRPHLTAGQGRPVCQPWWTGDEAAEQRPEAMPSTGGMLSAFPKYALSGCTAFIFEPFSIDTLTTMVREALDRIGQSKIQPGEILAGRICNRQDNDRFDKHPQTAY